MTCEVGLSRSVRAFHIMPGLPGPEGQLHDHDYRIEIVVDREQLDGRGMVCDLDVLEAALTELTSQVEGRNLEEIRPAGAEAVTVEVFARWVHDKSGGNASARRADQRVAGKDDHRAEWNSPSRSQAFRSCAAGATGGASRRGRRPCWHRGRGRPPWCSECGRPCHRPAAGTPRRAWPATSNRRPGRACEDSFAGPVADLGGTARLLRLAAEERERRRVDARERVAAQFVGLPIEGEGRAEQFDAGVGGSRCGRPRPCGCARRG